ncbi:MAG: hypothetical protein O3A76_11990 [Chloroflexi bacterium]|nr:hypothetical protein [Chloroflexota bacterium]
MHQLHAAITRNQCSLHQCPNCGLRNDGADPATTDVDVGSIDQLSDDLASLLRGSASPDRVNLLEPFNQFGDRLAVDLVGLSQLSLNLGKN